MSSIDDDKLEHPIRSIILAIIGVLVFFFGAALAIGVAEQDPTVHTQTQ